MSQSQMASDVQAMPWSTWTRYWTLFSAVLCYDLGLQGQLHLVSKVKVMLGLSPYRTCRLVANKEVHLPVVSSLKVFLEWVERRWLTSSWVRLPSIDDSLWKEMPTSITVTVVLHRFPTVASSGCLLVFWKSVTMWNGNGPREWTCRKYLSCARDNFYCVSLCGLRKWQTIL